MNLTPIAYLRLSGVNAKEHPVFRELIRVKQYFQKIKDIGSNNDMRIGPTLDKSAAGRFIKHALVIIKWLILNFFCANVKPKAASDVHDPRKVQRQISEKTHIRFNQSSNNLGVEEKNRSTPDIKSSSSSCSELNSLDSRNTQRSHIHKQSVSNAKRKHDGSIEGTSTTASTIGNQGHGDVTNKEKANKKRKTKKQGL